MELQNTLDAMQVLRKSGLDPYGALVGSLNTLFKVDQATQNAIKGWLLADNFRFHFEHNGYYRQSCLQQGVTPEQIRGFDDVTRIPLVPVRKFKDVDSHLLLSRPLSEIEFEMRSTGTSGIPSISRRDAPSVTRAVLGLYAMYREFFRLSRGAVLYLMPPTEEIPEMGMIKVLNMFSGLVDATRTVVKRVSFKPQDALNVLDDWQDIHTRHIIGPPFLIYKLVAYLKERGIRLKLDRNTRVITLGGWKRFTGMEIPREQFNAECAEYLGIAPNQVRDMYGLVEANILAVECAQQNKHVPPWVHFSVRDMNDLSREVPAGRRGLLAIMDPTSLSYPGFILTEDIVYLNSTDQCGCGRIGQQVVYLTRAKGAEVGCCAINLDRKMAEREAAEMESTPCPIAV